MTKFEGMGTNPFEEDEPLEIEDKKEKLEEQELKYIAARLDEWEKLKKSPLGVAVYTLLETKKQEAMNLAVATTPELLRHGIPIESHEAIRAEARGMCVVWNTIQNEPHQLLARQLEITKKKTEKEEENLTP